MSDYIVNSIKKVLSVRIHLPAGSLALRIFWVGTVKKNNPVHIIPLFLSDSGIPGPIYGSGCLSLKVAEKIRKKLWSFAKPGGGGGSARVNKN